MIEALEARAGHRAAAVSERIASNMIDDARAEAENTLRTVDAHSGADPEIAKQAQRIMGIASGRYRKHFLTERSNSNISIANAIADKLSADDARLLHVLEQVSNVKLQLHESGESVRLEGLDGVGREIARRALARLSKRNPPKSLDSDPEGWANKIRANLMREIETLGKRAFKVLQIPRAHPEIVDLVGRLNYRTSYTQNQWLHAVEASFLAGMMASELQLDEALARRATLMHDIGKALTHEIDGSHAVIGADIARRLGEDEVVANAIGAHHGDEPHNSVYAYLVAAADAMSGARPGARRELTELYSMRLNDLERIGQSYRGVDRAFAVHGGRELRVYVRQSSVSDAQAVELSGEIAEQIADEMTFPGQIKVTVIREFEAVATAH
jgi:ribonuclease Y